MSIVFEEATKLYGPVIGINRISCTIGQGITALFGANGAGKSTILKLASGMLRPTLGRVLLDGFPAWSQRAKERLGYSPDLDRFHEDRPVRNFVTLMAELHGFPRTEAADRAEAALRTVRMHDRADRLLGGCSKGMRQRAKLAAALVHDPPCLLLDEPMTGVDPGGRRELSEVFVELARGGRTLLLSSHLLQEVEPLADRMLMIARGRLVAAGTIARIRELLADRPLTIELELTDPRTAAADLLACTSVDGIDLVGEVLRIRTARPDDLLRRIGDRTVDAGWHVRRLEVLDGGAEAIFGYLDGGAP